MDKVGYLKDARVQEFVGWLVDRLDRPGSLRHAYINKTTYARWECHSLYDAALKYSWKFSCVHPITGATLQGHTLQDSLELLRELRVLLRGSLLASDPALCLKICKAIVEWGGVASQIKSIEALGANICEYLVQASLRFDITKFRTTSLPRQGRMSLGFSKVYALLLDDFVMYESRLAAALCLLVRRFCKEYSLPAVPACLAFCLIPHRGPTNRDPSTNVYRFITVTDQSGYMDNSMQASWLLKTVLEHGRLSKLSSYKADALVALTAALFMIGYEVPGIAVE